MGRKSSFWNFEKNASFLMFSSARIIWRNRWVNFLSAAWTWINLKCCCKRWLKVNLHWQSLLQNTCDSDSGIIWPWISWMIEKILLLSPKKANLSNAHYSNIVITYAWVCWVIQEQIVLLLHHIIKPVWAIPFTAALALLMLSFVGWCIKNKYCSYLLVSYPIKPMWVMPAIVTMALLMLCFVGWCINNLQCFYLLLHHSKKPMYARPVTSIVVLFTLA